MSIERLLELTSPEVKAAIEQICDKAGTSDADWQVLKAAGELLAAAKAASEFALTEIDQLKQALTHVRHYMQAQGPNGVGIREFAAICGVSPTLISKWTSPPLPGVPDFID